MAPEHPPELVVFDASFEHGQLKGDLHYIEIPAGQRLRVRWDAESQPEGFRAVAGGVAYVADSPELKVPSPSRDAIADDLGDSRYRWKEGLNLSVPWVMSILVLPEGHTVSDAAPKPARAKVFRDRLAFRRDVQRLELGQLPAPPKVFKDRLALYWILKGDEVGRTSVECVLRKFDGAAAGQIIELNQLCAGRRLPASSVINIEDPPRPEEAMPASDTPKPVFISYAHEDNDSTDRSKRWLDRLTQFLQPLAEQDELTICSDQDIALGDDWHAHIQKHLDGARAAVLRVSPAFLASNYVRNSELPVLLRNAKEHGVKIIPVILRPCHFAETRFKFPDPKTGPEEFTLASLQAAGSPDKALSEMTEGEQDRTLLKVAQTLLQIVKPNPK
ncbi:MAG TPA: toll/interleukin-1 receptor domain-containing protein [Opitutaceae bacterium]